MRPDKAGGDDGTPASATSTPFARYAINAIPDGALLIWTSAYPAIVEAEFPVMSHCLPPLFGIEKFTPGDEVTALLLTVIVTAGETACVPAASRATAVNA